MLLFCCFLDELVIPCSVRKRSKCSVGSAKRLFSLQRWKNTPSFAEWPTVLTALKPTATFVSENSPRQWTRGGKRPCAFERPQVYFFPFRVCFCFLTIIMRSLLTFPVSLQTDKLPVYDAVDDAKMVEIVALRFVLLSHLEPWACLFG